MIKVGVAIGLMALLVTGCTHESSTGPSFTVVASQSTSSHRTPAIDRRFAEIGSRVPGFAGAYFKDGKVVVALAGAHSLEAARAEVAAFLRTKVHGKRFGVDPTQFEFVPARYSFLALKRWREAFEARFDFQDVVSTDVDEVKNKVSIAVRTVDAEEDARTQLLALGAPEEAFEVRVRERKTAAGTLVQHTDTMRGGYQILTSIGSACTTGAIVKRPNASAKYVLTAAHCSYYGLDTDSVGIAYSQPNGTVNTWFFGYEVADGTQFVGCGTKCTAHFSADAALADISINSHIAAFGEVASVSTGINVNGSFAYNDAEYFPWVGEQVSKVGISSGFTAAEIQYVGVNVTADDKRYPAGSGYYMKIDDVNTTNPLGQPGDSGSPVYNGGAFFGVLSTTEDFTGVTNIDNVLGQLVYY